MGPQTQANVSIFLLDHVYQALFANMKIERYWGGAEPSMLPWEKKVLRPNL